MKTKVLTLALLAAVTSPLFAQHNAVAKQHYSAPHDHSDHTPRVHDRTTTVRFTR